MNWISATRIISSIISATRIISSIISATRYTCNELESHDACARRPSGASSVEDGCQPGGISPGSWQDSAPCDGSCAIISCALACTLVTCAQARPPAAHSHAHQHFCTEHTTATHQRTRVYTPSKLVCKRSTHQRAHLCALKLPAHILQCTPTVHLSAQAQPTHKHMHSYTRSTPINTAAHFQVHTPAAHI